MNTFFNVFALAEYEGKYLILQRSPHRNDPNDWNCVTGHVQDRESAEEGALRELKEETNLNGSVIRSSEVFGKTIGNTRWVVVASLIEVKDISDIQIDKEESQNYKWIDSNDPIIKKYEALRDTFKYLGLQ